MTVEPISAYDVGKMRLENLSKMNRILSPYSSGEISAEDANMKLRLLFASMQGDLKEIMDSIAVYSPKF